MNTDLRTGDCVMFYPHDDDPKRTQGVIREITPRGEILILRQDMDDEIIVKVWDGSVIEILERK